MPVYRNRINPATGRPHRDDKQLGRTQDQALAQWKARRDLAAQRARHNQQFVRETLRRRDPAYADRVERAADRVARDVARSRRRVPARSGRSR
jgi:hypothetical protein